MTDTRTQGLYSKSTMSNLMNISERRLEQLTKSEIIPKAGRGVYDLGQAVQAYIRYLQGLSSGAIKSGEPSGLDKRLLEAKVLERESKARQAKYRADAMERELEDKSLADKVRGLRQRVMSRLKLYDYETRASVEDAIETAVREILSGRENV